jgi:hypothetical protein
MFDSFPYEEWGENIAEFWTFGGEGSTGTYILTALGVAAMILAFIGFVRLEHRKVTAQAARLKASGALDQPTVAVTAVIIQD